MAAIHPDALVAAALQDYARTNGRDILSIVSVDAIGQVAESETSVGLAAGADVGAILAVRPMLACTRRKSAPSNSVSPPVPDQSDSLRLAVEVGAGRRGDLSRVSLTTFGEMLFLFMDARTVQVRSPAQYQPLLDQWAKSLAGRIYWWILRAVLRQ